ncbi:MAG: hypothetical protein H6817_02315 [Phycisphaerales bacterium]|nr:hypothetical protein [Phycisphaerales bacterium]
MLRQSVKMTLLVALALCTPAAFAAPKPSAAVRNWELDFEFHDLQRIELQLPGDSRPTTYWYLLYTVTNNSGKDVDFYPSFELVTSSLQVVTAGDHISPRVNDAIAARHIKLFPFFRDPTKVAGRLLQGPDNARTSAAVFRNFDPDANALQVFVSGLSGEIVSVPNPVFDPESPESQQNVRFFPLRKTFVITYDLPGDVRTRRESPAIRTGTEWVMR